MPNHITNVLRVTAYTFQGADPAQIDEVIAAVVGDRPFDFNRLIPMPADLNITSGGSTYMAMELLGIQGGKFFPKPLPKSDAERDALRARYLSHAQEGFPTLDDLAARVRSNLDKHGHADWYEWRYQNWGTKWNAYEVIAGKPDDTSVIFHFETAWAPPLPVLDKLASMFPKLNFRLLWADEGSDRYHTVYWDKGGREVDDATEAA